MAESFGKSYEQQCPLAMALDHVGDRWTLLVVRELLAGPARFGELERGLRGVAPNLLSGRLKRLTLSGIVEQRTFFGSSVYALTDLGERLRPALEELGLWGVLAGPLPGTEPAPIPNARTAAIALQSMLSAVEVPGAAQRIGLRIDDDLLVIRLGGVEPTTVRTWVGDECDATVVTTLDAVSVMPTRGLPARELQPATSAPADREAADLLARLFDDAVQLLLASS